MTTSEALERELPGLVGRTILVTVMRLLIAARGGLRDDGTLDRDIVRAVLTEIATKGFRTAATQLAAALQVPMDDWLEGEIDSAVQGQLDFIDAQWRRGFTC